MIFLMIVVAWQCAGLTWKIIGSGESVDSVNGSSSDRNMRVPSVRKNGAVRASVSEIPLFGKSDKGISKSTAGTATVPLTSLALLLKGVVLVDPEKGSEFVKDRPVVVEKMIFSEQVGWRTRAKTARVHQWLKNLLIFVPLITAHQIGDVGLVLRALSAFSAFSLCASAIYLFNDLIDLNADRQHRSKRIRPLASGRISIKQATWAIPVLLIAAFVLGLYPGKTFLAILGAYIVLTTLYSCWLKKLVVVDVVVLALLYTFRLLAGGAAIAIMPSFWLLSFSMFIFFSLALMKRSADLVLGRNSEQNLMVGRGYVGSDAAIVQMFGIASGYMSVLVLALYINSDDVRLLYTHPELIWILCPLFFYWISRVWLITSRGDMTDDPVLFAVRDRVSQSVALITATILWLAA